MEVRKGNLGLEVKARRRALDKEVRARWDTEATSSAAIMVVAVGVAGDGSSRRSLIHSS